MTTYSYFVTVARGVSPLLADELRELGCRVVREEPGGCRVRGPLELGYRICLWSRLASRVLLHIADLAVHDEAELYRGIGEIAWETHLAPEHTLAIDYVGQRAAVAHGQFGAQRTKDAIVDRLKRERGTRPDVDLDAPDLRINVFARGSGCSVSIDLAGESLHRRGWRTTAGTAPLRETIAATMLVDAGWPELARQGAAFVDPMAGSGTLVFEALAMAADIAPGVGRERFGLHGWMQHDAALWTTVHDEARRRADEGLAGMSNVLVGADADVEAVERARINADAMGWGDRIAFEQRTLQQWEQAPAPRGLVATNPPYGKRLGGPVGARRIAGELGRCLSRVFSGWRAQVLLGDERITHVLGSAVESARPIDNGPIEAVAVRFEVGQQSPQAEVGRSFANRIKKNRRKLSAWLKREGVTCYRIYDADIPEANAAVDRYEDWAHVQEYEAPATIDPVVAQARLDAMLFALPDALGIGPDKIVVKRRSRQRGTSQYEKHADVGVRFKVVEGGHQFWINLEDYLDTGLFLDHRPVRALIADKIAARSAATFLNLFAYTASATVYAVGAGAAKSTSVDLSNTYNEWAAENLELAGANPTAHRIVRADVRRFLKEERRKYDVILLDPPTFSTSKAMDGTLDIVRDHAELIDDTMQVLAPGGELVFSTNARRFKLDASLAARYTISDISEASIPPDFSRNRRIHRCFVISAK